MKTWIVLLVLVLCLAGCSDPTWETLGSVEHVSATLPPMAVVTLQLPQEAAVLSATGTDTIYLCDGYSIALQTVSAGDLTATIRSISGYDPAELTVLESGSTIKRYDLVWSAAGEAGAQVCRGVILDDGNYHYTLTLMADAQQVLSLQESWNALLTSFDLEA